MARRGCSWLYIEELENDLKVNEANEMNQKYSKRKKVQDQSLCKVC